MLTREELASYAVKVLDEWRFALTTTELRNVISHRPFPEPYHPDGHRLAKALMDDPRVVMGWRESGASRTRTWQTVRSAALAQKEADEDADLMRHQRAKRKAQTVLASRYRDEYQTLVDGFLDSSDA
jgi:hypothetical protein